MTSNRARWLTLRHRMTHWGRRPPRYTCPVHGQRIGVRKMCPTCGPRWRQ